MHYCEHASYESKLALHAYNSATVTVLLSVALACRPMWTTTTCQAAVLLLLVTLLTSSSTYTAAQEAVVTAEAAAASADAPSTAQPDAFVSPSIVSRVTRARNIPIRQQNFTERHNMLTAMPDFKPVTYQEMVAEQVGGAIASVVPSSDSGDVDPQASGTAGANYADSRFGTGADYASFASKAVGRLSMRFGGVWYVCTASFINKALLVTAAHCVFKYGKKTTGWPDIVNGQLQVCFELRKGPHNLGCAPSLFLKSKKLPYFSPQP